MAQSFVEEMVRISETWFQQRRRNGKDIGQHIDHPRVYDA